MLLHLPQSVEQHFQTSPRLAQQSGSIIEPFMCLSGASNGHWFLGVDILARSGAASKKAALLQNDPSLSWMNTQEGKENDKERRNKKWQLCSLQQFGSARRSGCSAERSSMCFRDRSGRGGAETAGSRRQTGNSWLIKHGDGGQHSGGVWGPAFQPGDKHPQYQLEQASVSRTPHHATPAIISNKPHPCDQPPPFSSALHLHNQPDWLTGDLQGKLLQAFPLREAKQVSLSAISVVHTSFFFSFFLSGSFWFGLKVTANTDY